jgi:hypothetical protein
MLSAYSTPLGYFVSKKAGATARTDAVASKVQRCLKLNVLTS